MIRESPTSAFETIANYTITFSAASAVYDQVGIAGFIYAVSIPMLRNLTIDGSAVDDNYTAARLEEDLRIAGKLKGAILIYMNVARATQETDSLRHESTVHVFCFSIFSLVGSFDLTKAAFN